MFKDNYKNYYTVNSSIPQLDLYPEGLCGRVLRGLSFAELFYDFIEVWAAFAYTER